MTAVVVAPPLLYGTCVIFVCVTMPKRAPARCIALPDVPTAIEAGFKDYEVIGWFGLMAPRGTAPAIVEQLARETAAAMQNPDIRSRATQQGATPVGNTPAEFERFVRSEVARWTKIIRQAGISLE